MQLCSRCHKRPAVVFVTRMENNETKNEGLCLQCAKELGLPVDNILKNMGVDSDDIDSIGAEIDALMGQELPDEPSMGGDEDNNAPAIDFKSLFGKISSEINGAKADGKNKAGQETKDKKQLKQL